MAIDNKSFFDSILPNVYFKNISLESSGMEYQEINPHIDSEREPNVIRDPKTGKLKRESIPAFGERKTKNSSKKLFVNIQLVIKEKLDDGLVSTWFENINFVKYLKVIVFQSLDKEITNSFIKNIITNKDLYNDKNIKQNLISVSDVVKKSKLNQIDSSVDDNGNKIYDITLNTNFTLNNENPQHLSYFAVSYIDIKELAKEMNLDLNNEDNMYGKTASELIFDDYILNSRAFVFVDEQNNIWVGDVHQTQQGNWAKYKDVQKNEEILQLITVSNNKVQDSRTSNELEQIEFDITPYTQQINNIINKINGQKIINLSNTSYFSEASISRDKNGDVRFLFAINFLQMVREKTQFGSIFTSNVLDLLKYVRISQMVIRRIRVKSDSIEGYIGKVFNTEDPPENFITRASSVGTLREINISLEDTDILGMRYFTGMDKFASDITFGLYQYEVILQIEDKTPLFLREQANKLSKQINDLQKYYNQCLYNYDYDKNRLNNKFINTLSNKSNKESPWISSISIFIETMLFFSQKTDFSDFQKLLFYYVNPKTATLDTILKVINIIKDSVNQILSIAKVSVAGTEKRRTSGQKQDDGGGNFSQTLKSIEISNTFTKIFDSDIPKNVGYDFLTLEGKIETENNDGLVVISGLKFEERTKIETLKYFKSEDININLKSQIKEYTVDDSLANSKYTYLSPTMVNLGDQKVTLTNGIENNTQQYQQISSTVTRFNALRKSPFLPIQGTFNTSNNNTKVNTTQQKTRSNLLSTVSERGLVIESEREQVSKEKTTSTADVFGVNSTFETQTKQDNPVINNLETSNQEIKETSNSSLFLMLTDDFVTFENKKEEEIKFYNINEPFHILENKSQNKIVELPNQIKSLMVGLATPENINEKALSQAVDIKANPFLKPLYNYKYNMLQTIEVLTGFEKNETEAYVKIPIWKKMTPALFNMTKDKNILCRLKPYNNPEFQVTQPKDLKLMIYNEYFILSPHDIIPEESPQITVVTKITEITEDLSNKEKEYKMLEGEYYTTQPIGKPKETDATQIETTTPTTNAFIVNDSRRFKF